MKTMIAILCAVLMISAQPTDSIKQLVPKADVTVVDTLRHELDKSDIEINKAKVEYSKSYLEVYEKLDKIEKTRN